MTQLARFPNSVAPRRRAPVAEKRANDAMGSLVGDEYEPFYAEPPPIAPNRRVWRKRGEYIEPSLRALASMPPTFQPPRDPPPTLETLYDINTFPQPNDYPAYVFSPSNAPEGYYAREDMRTHTGVNGAPEYDTYARTAPRAERSWIDVDNDIAMEEGAARHAKFYSTMQPPQPRSEVASWCIAREDDDNDDAAAAMNVDELAAGFPTASLAYEQVH